MLKYSFFSWSIKKLLGGIGRGLSVFHFPKQFDFDCSKILVVLGPTPIKRLSCKCGVTFLVFNVSAVESIAVTFEIVQNEHVPRRHSSQTFFKKKTLCLTLLFSRLKYMFSIQLYEPNGQFNHRLARYLHSNFGDG